MPKRSSKPDTNQMAKSIVDQATGEAEPDVRSAAATLGRLGGLKGGPARAKKLSKARKSEIAKKAANARWQPRSQ